MKKLFLILPVILMHSALLGTNYYLHVDMVSPTNWTTKAAWFDDPVGGVDMGAATFGGNHFYLNGWDCRTGGSGTAATTFSGSSLNLANASERLDLLAFEVNIPNILNVSGGATVLIHGSRSAVALTVGTLNVNGTSSFRGANADEALTLAITTLAGSGDLVFGNKSATAVDAGSYSISATSTSGFTGRLVADDGVLTIASADFSKATLYVYTGDVYKTGTVDISTSASFAAIQGTGFADIPVGTYTASELNTLTSSSIFSGAGTLTVVPPPAKQFYLQANMPSGTAWTDKASWFDATSGGTDMLTLGEVFEGNDFSLNTYDLRTGVNEFGESNFNGASLTISNSAERLDLMAAIVNIPNTLNASGGGTILVHATRSAVALNVGTLNASGTFSVRGANADESIALAVATLAGSGDLVFGNKSTTAVDLGSYSINAADTTGFTGRLLVDDGVLTIASADFSLATLYLYTGDIYKTGTVNIGTSASFAAIESASVSIAPGTYTAAELNALFSATLFSGAGTLSVGVPVPAAPAVVTGAVVNGSNEFVIDFAGVASTEYEVKKSTDLGTFDPLTPALTATTDGSGIGQVTVPASEMGGAAQFFVLEEVAP